MKSLIVLCALSMSVPAFASVPELLAKCGSNAAQVQVTYLRGQAHLRFNGQYVGPATRFVSESGAVYQSGGMKLSILNNRGSRRDLPAVLETAGGAKLTLTCNAGMDVNRIMSSRNAF